MEIIITPLPLHYSSITPNLSISLTIPTSITPQNSQRALVLISRCDGGGSRTQLWSLVPVLMFDDSVHYHWISSGASCHIKPLNLIQRLFGLSTVWRAHGLVKDDDMCRWTVCHADKVCTSTTSPSIISRHIPSPSSIPTHHRQLCQCCGFMSQFLGNWGIPCIKIFALLIGLIEWHFWEDATINSTINVANTTSYAGER